MEEVAKEAGEASCSDSVWIYWSCRSGNCGVVVAAVVYC